jgi:peptidoglycan/xylan/chitin deacetylase (PgdA/CDA1 family)
MSGLVSSFAFLFRVFLKITNKPVVLCYHRITKQKLDTQITFFKKLGEIKPFKDLVSNSINAKPKFSMALTMDDCYYQDFVNATEVLGKHNTHCTFFVPTKYSIDNTPLWPLKVIKTFKDAALSIKNEDGEEVKFAGEQEKEAYKNNLINEWASNTTQTAEVEKIVEKFCAQNNYTPDSADNVIKKEIIEQYSSNTLFSFQSHTVTHPKLYLQTESEQEDEFVQSKEYLQNASGEEQYLICYPYGSAKHIGNSHTTARKYYTYGVTLQAGSIKKSTNPMLIPRVGIYEHDTPFRILLKILNSQFK